MWVILGLDVYLDVIVEIFNCWGSLVYVVLFYSILWNGELNKGFEVDGGKGRLLQFIYFYLIWLNDVDNIEYKGYFEL